MSEPTVLAVPDEMPSLGGHPVLDFLNTVVSINGELVDLLQSDTDVLHWLTQAGWPMNAATTKLRPSSLPETARGLRMAIRAVVERRKAATQGVEVLRKLL